MDTGGEELGQRCAHRLLPGRAACEVDVRIDGEAHARQHMPERDGLLALEAAAIEVAYDGMEVEL